MDDDPIEFATQSDWDAWLSTHHATRRQAWIKIAKKASGIRSVTAAQALDIALRYGWIDGQRKSLDTEYFLQRYTPRRVGSTWSKINRDRVEVLIAEGLAHPAGLAEVALAKSDGRWAAAYASSSTIEVPADLQAALDADPSAKSCFEALNSQNRYSILYRLQDAKKPETRTRRLAKYLDMLNRGEKIY